VRVVCLPQVHDVAWAPDDSLLASCSVDNTVRIWRVPLLGGLAGLEGGHGIVPPAVVLAPERTLCGHTSWVSVGVSDAATRSWVRYRRCRVPLFLFFFQ
jgi:WD40 repeat protein